MSKDSKINLQSRNNFRSFPGTWHVWACVWACMHICVCVCVCLCIHVRMLHVCVFPMQILGFLYDIPYMYLVLLKLYSSSFFLSLSTSLHNPQPALNVAYADFKVASCWCFYSWCRVATGHWHSLFSLCCQSVFSLHLQGAWRKMVRRL